MSMFDKVDFGLGDCVSVYLRMVPVGKDGKPIECNERVYGEDGHAWIVEGWCSGSYNVIANDPLGKVHKHLKDKWLTHERPPRTKLEIVADMRKMAGIFDTDDEKAASAIRGWADELEKANK